MVAVETRHRVAARVVPVNDEGTIFEARWWRPDDVAGEQLANGSLPDVLRKAVATVRTPRRLT